MSGPRSPNHGNRHSIEPLVIDRTPRIIQRSPEAPARRTSHSETRSIFSRCNPFSRQNRTRVLVTERTIRRRHRAGGEQAPSARNDPDRGRPPAPPIFPRPTRSQSTPADRRSTNMSPAQGQRGYVPLPPKIPSDEDSRSSRERESGRKSRTDRRSQVVQDPIQIVEGSATGRRSPRPYHHRRQQTSDPFDATEQVLEPSSPRPQKNSPNFEVVQPNETTRSRPDVLKEYHRMKELAEHNFRVAERAAERYSHAEVRLQNLQKQVVDQEKQLNDEKMAHGKTIQREEDLRNDMAKLLREVETLRLEHHVAGRERDLREHEAKIAKNQLEIERQQADKADPDRKRGKERARSRERDSHESSGNDGGRRSRRPRVVKVTDSRDAEPRSFRRGEGLDAVAQARGDALKSPRIIQREPDDFLNNDMTVPCDPASDAIARARREAASRQDKGTTSR